MLTKDMENSAIYVFAALALVACLVIVVVAIRDLARDRQLSGRAKVIWYLSLGFVPVLSALVYIVVRSDSMAERIAQQTGRKKNLTDEWLQ
ncbi:hypothetical protein NBH20_19370 [Rhizobium sp. S153]|uniref:Cardiolipin synthase N-terminal domain-containing protein n=1 Tax=Ciceribacter sichuanensis TaxID=2949647 RepID=A0ABT0VBT8_9HYPH|nr:hypothetical protein [Ciceribacter sp. S153]MCM2403335.1 hypothetical protein [Ciceribacter sp. S153]